VRLLCSYFFDRPTHLNDLWFRDGPVVQEFWTLPSVPGARLGDVPLFVLTSSRTFSGAEECAYDLQTQHRATIVGETTGGGANPGGDQPIDEQLSVFVPVGKAVNPVTGTNWEGTGVAPDVACPAGQALDRALELARREAARRAAERSAERIEILHGIQDDVHAAGAAYAAGDPDQGAEILRAALSDGAAAGAVNQLVALRLAGAETGAGRLEVAAGLLGAAVELWPELGAAWSALSDVDEQRGAKEEALGAARRVLALDPHDVGARARVERLSGK